MHRLHGLYVVDEYDILEDDKQPLSIELEGADTAGKGEFANGGLPLLIVSWQTKPTRGQSYLCVDDAQEARRRDYCDERGGKEHLEDGNVTRRSIFAERRLETKSERVGRVNSEPIGRG